MTIKILSQDIAAKIAAGEVVERPLSVVKELLENAIDAGAKEIRIQIESAGRRLIQVEDNGIGIPSAETSLALQRYATSKISSVEDLEEVNTLGFRGEALASIAAVSRLSLDSKVKLENIGIHLVSEGGNEQVHEPAGMNNGTRIIVEDLFFNVPARRKFLKSENTERRVITELVNRYALYYAGIRFQLTIEGRKALVTNGNGDKREVLSQIYDVELARKLLDIKVVDEYLGVAGFISPTSVSRSNRKEIFFFINGRLIMDAALNTAVTHAYQNMMMVGRYPIAALFLHIDPLEMDVNVHPTKAEVRFRDSKRVFSLIHSAVRKTISAFSNVPQVSPSLWVRSEAGTRIIDPAWNFSAQTRQPASGEPAIEQGQGEEKRLEPDKPTIVNIPLLRLIGQIGRTYLAAEGPDGLYLIDQHAAHERILFEKMSKAHGNLDSQFLLEPVVLQLTGQMENDLNTQIDLINHLGFQVENFGPATYRITAIPTYVSHIDPKEALLSALEQDEEDVSILEDEKEKKIISRICKRAAVKGGQVLSAEEQERLIRDLEQCESPRTCPHGRPTMIHLSVDMLERQFGRRGSR